MPFFIKPFFRKPFKLFAIDADIGQPLDPNVHRRTRVTYYELAEGSNGSKKLVAHKSPSQITKEGGEEGKAEAEAKPAEGEGSKKEGSKKEEAAKEGSKKEGSKKEEAPKEGSKKEGSKKEGSKKEGSKKEGSKKEGSKKEGSKKEGSKKEGAPKDGSKKGDEAKAEPKGNDVAWTPEEDEKLKAMKAANKSWKIIAEEMGRAQHVLKSRFKEIGGAASNDQGTKNADGKGQNDKEKQGGGGGQGKQGKKGKKGDDAQQNNQNNHQKKNDDKNDNKNTNEKSNQDKKESEMKPSSSKKEEEESKPTSKPASAQKPASNPPSNKPASVSNNSANNETRFTMTDWLTLQEDDMFSFGELQCLSELIGKDLSQSWQRVAARFFDLTGRRIHPDNVRDKFERMTVMAQGGKGV
jgi:hypothetical protein